MKTIEMIFRQDFEHWEICLPSLNISQRKRGQINESGWSIKYLFGKDEKGEYLDYYASHRMTDDRHIRIYNDGKTTSLPTIGSCHFVSENPEENARIEKEFYSKNQRVEKMLEEKGFGIQGNEPGGVQINNFLRTNNID